MSRPTNAGTGIEKEAGSHPKNKIRVMGMQQTDDENMASGI